MPRARTHVDSSGRVARRQLGHVLIGSITYPLVDVGTWAAVYTARDGSTHPVLYHAGNLVDQGGTTYLCVAASTTAAPPGADWTLWKDERYFLRADRVWAIASSGSRYSDQLIADDAGGLVLYWKLDELGNTTADAVDSSGNGHTGTYGNAPYHGTTDHPTLGVTGLADGTAAQFDGFDDMVGIYGDVPGIQAFGEMSVEFWMKSSQAATFDGGTSLDLTRAGIITSDTSSPDGRFFRVELTVATGQLRNINTGTDANGHAVDGVAVVNDGVRHHVVCTFDGTTMKIYVDGVLDNSATPSMGGFPLANANHGLFVGGGHPIPGPFVEQSHYQGVLDELALYTVALPIGSVQTHFLIGNTSNPPSGTAGGDLTGSYPNPSLAAFGPGATGPIGDATHVARVTIDGKGRVSALSSVAISGAAPGGAAGGDLTGTYPNPTLAAAGPGATGPIGDATHVAAVTIDAKGRVTALTSVAISTPADVGVTAAPSADDTASGLKIDLTAGEALAMGDPVYIKSDGKVWKADANTAGTFPAIGIAVTTAAANATVTVLLHGVARHDAWAWTVGGLIYLSTSSGLTQTQPTATDDCIQVLGVATHADRMLVQPNLVYITHT